MPTYFRRDDSVQNGLGQAVPNVAVTYFLNGQTLAAVFSGPEGGSTGNPQYTNGLGFASAYMAPGQYTVMYSGPQIQTLTLPDQTVGSSGSGSSVTTFSGVPSGSQDGVNRVFTFSIPSNPSLLTVWLNTPLIVNEGYTVSWDSGTLTIVYTNPPAAEDNLYLQGFYET